MSEDTKESHIEDSKVEDSKIQNSNIEGSKIEDSQIIDSSIEDSQIKDSKIFNQHIVRNHKEKFLYYKDKFLDIAKTRKFQIIAIAVILLTIILLSSWIRFSNLPLLKDSTTGEYIPLALDPFYFLRIAELKLEGPLPAVDVLRYPALGVGFTTEILPDVLALMYRAANLFGEYSLEYINVISPVLFFSLSLIIFFFLIYILTKSKIASLLGSALLAFIPSYLYRTMAGFSDHESLGMLAFFAAMLVCSISLKFISDKDGGKNLTKLTGLGLLSGLLTAFSIVAWGGGATFIFLVFPLSFLLVWAIKLRDSEEKKFIKKGLLLYCLWIISVIVFGVLLGSNFGSITRRFVTGTNGLVTSFVLIFILIDSFLILNIKKFKFFKEKFRQAYSFTISLVLGLIGLTFIGKNPFSLIQGIWSSLLHPFGVGRTGLTIAENSQPYLTSWISQSGEIIFWTFILGVLFMGFELAKTVQKKRNKFLLGFSWLAMVSAILFSRISANHVLNGTNFISQLMYLSGLLFFVASFIYIYFKDKIKLKPEIIFMVSWAFFVLISGRAAIRIFFTITPFICFSSAFFTVKLFEYAKKSKDSLLRIILFLALILIIIGLIFSFNTFVNSIVVQAKSTGPSANLQWQNAMSWVRENTNEGDIFVHWWDYGYWVQSLGKRPSVTDGGHYNGFWDHLVARYLLTTPKPETALSFMKSHDVSYLLIDQTDVGKYSAYSKIGGNNESDRFSMVPVAKIDEKQTIETANKTTFVYPLGAGVDEDIIHNFEGQEILLPGPTYNERWDPNYKSFVAAIILEVSHIKGKKNFNQPSAVIYYNEKQIRIPLRYLYYGGKIYDFENGIESVISIVPLLSQTEIKDLGTVIYLSPKVSQSLFAQVYLLNDVFGNYPSLKLKHSEQDPFIQSIKDQGLPLGEFVYYNMLRGPIKIWEVNYQENTLKKEEFLRTSGEYAEFDWLEFIK